MGKRHAPGSNARIRSLRRRAACRPRLRAPQGVWSRKQMGGCGAPREFAMSAVRLSQLAPPGDGCIGQAGAPHPSRPRLVRGYCANRRGLSPVPRIGRARPDRGSRADFRQEGEPSPGSWRTGNPRRMGRWRLRAELHTGQDLNATIVALGRIRNEGLDFRGTALLI